MPKFRVSLTVDNYMDFIAEFPDGWTISDIIKDVTTGYWDSPFDPTIEVEQVEDDAEVGDIA